MKYRLPHIKNQEVLDTARQRNQLMKVILKRQLGLLGHYRVTRQDCESVINKQNRRRLSNSKTMKKTFGQYV